jgi:Xaa-Pro dipeptidase
MTTRIDRLRTAMRDADTDMLAIVPGANLLYLLGLTMHSSERLAVAFIGREGDVGLVLPALEQPRAEAEARVRIRCYPWHDADGYEQALKQCITQMGIGGTLAVEYTAMRVLELRAIEAAAMVETSDATPMIAQLRITKDADELAAMCAAVQAVEAGLREAIAFMRPGVTEREVADVWEQAMRTAGSEGTSFTTIVASGPNSANPHHTTGDRQLQPGDLVVLDGGARVGGYMSDITRTVAVGEPGPEARRLYETVLAANRAGVAAVQQGVSGADIDAAARDIIDAAGYGAYFVHRTGHGLGIEIHEPPYLHANSTAPLPLCATFTVEPGVYVSGVGGVRIEDDVVLTENGGKCLTTFERELIVR